MWRGFDWGFEEWKNDTTGLIPAKGGFCACVVHTPKSQVPLNGSLFRSLHKYRIPLIFSSVALPPVSLYHKVR